AYKAAMLAWRSGSRGYLRDLEHVVELDPALAQARVRLGILMFPRSPSEAREHAREATNLRSDLSARDALLLDAMEAYVRPERGGVRFVKRMEAATLRYPNDAELVLFLAFARGELVPPDFAGAVEAFDRSLAIDPGFAPAWKFKAEYEAYLGR